MAGIPQDDDGSLCYFSLEFDEIDTFSLGHGAHDIQSRSLACRYMHHPSLRISCILLTTINLTYPECLVNAILGSVPVVALQWLHKSGPARVTVRKMSQLSQNYVLDSTDPGSLLC